MQNWLKMASSKSSVVGLADDFADGVGGDAQVQRRQFQADSAVAMRLPRASRAARARRNASSWRELIMTCSISRLRCRPAQTFSLIALFQFLDTLRRSGSKHRPRPIPGGNCSRAGKSVLLRTMSRFFPAKSDNNCLSASVQWLGGVEDVQDQLRRRPARRGCGGRLRLRSSSAASRNPAVSIKTTGQAANVGRFLDGVARRAGNGRDDGAVVAQELIEQAGFADVGPADDRRANAAAQHPAFVGGAQIAVDEIQTPRAIRPSNCPRVSGAMSSSGKSMCASMCARIFIKSSRKALMRWESLPASCSWAAARANSVRE